jgi:hypothetical protein
MFVIFGRTKQERWARAAVVALCLLVLVFSFAAKLSLYQSKSTQITALASSKMWQHELQDAAAVMAAPDELSLQPAWPIIEYSMSPVLAAVILILASLSTFQWLERETAPAVRRGEFVSSSQLRAPPAR